MNNFLMVALGGAIGSTARYGVNILAGRVAAGYPLGTLAVNILGCFAMGLLASVLALKGVQHLAPFLLTGVLGGFTTFSAFALDTMTLWGRGEQAVALVYVAASVGVSVLAVMAGLSIGRGVFA
ncbi:MAG: fluoride efflux transporter CrcB [Paracoccus sp. (in: a-proteobacteria)]|uniref:fluoride efflux transporter CrcB n=1 Tax=Paracoccus sp. TaxID=267 RepID=UPI0039E5EE5C